MRARLVVGGVMTYHRSRPKQKTNATTTTDPWVQTNKVATGKVMASLITGVLQHICILMEKTKLIRVLSTIAEPSIVVCSPPTG